ncbi:MAG: hypothetical protein SV375_03685, partial [Thermodesulfobacteriota bacterium]|nr:hypothetical protein [Thermodesulfobacteriota bacterium]
MSFEKITLKIKNLFFSITAIFLGLIVLLGISEIILRFTNTTPYHRNALNAFHVADPYLGWRGLANFSGVFIKEDFNAFISINEKGYRKKASNTIPLPDAIKIIFLGDSFAWGWGVRQGEIFSDFLQDQLGKKYNVISLGVNTFGTVQETIQLKREVVPLRPDYVGLMVYGNDFRDNLDSRNNNRPYCDVEGDRVILKNLPIENPIGSMYRSFTRMSYALTHLRYYHNYLIEYKKLITNFLKKKKYKISQDNKKPKYKNALNPDAILVFKHYIGLINKICLENRIKLFIIYIPRGDNIMEDQG